jgi:hypothetical protein
MIRGFATLSAIAVLGFALLTGATEASVEQALVIDRTFGCIPSALTGNVRATDVTAVPRGSVEPNDTMAPRSPGFVGVATGGREAGSELVSVRARRWQRFGNTYSPAGLYVNRGCSASRIPVPLSRKGLGGMPTRWMESVTCLGRGRVIIRVRAQFASGDPWRELVTSRFDGASGNVVTASLAVRSERTGKPLAYMELAKDGTTKLWHAPSCKR